MEDSHYTAFPNGARRPRVHIIGNGASNSLFDVDAEYRIACNIPQHGIQYNCLAIIDIVVVNWMKDNNYQPNVPIMCTNKVKEHAVKQNRNGHWFDVFEIKHRYSAGHHAVEHHASMTDEIHLWGFDSIWTNEYASQMDTLVPRGRRPNLNQQWLPHWQNIFADAKNTQFIIHAPEHAQLPTLGDNVAQAK